MTMEKYLAVITTVLVLTQIVRVTQNAIQLHLQNKEIKRNINWITEREITKEDFDCQREVMYLLRDKLKQGRW